MKTAAEIATHVFTKIADLQRKAPDELVKELGAMTELRREDAYKNLLKNKQFADIVKGTDAQRDAAILGALSGGLLGGGLGVGTLLWTGERRLAPLGLAMGLAPGMGGYILGKRHQKEKELRDFLER